MSSPALATPRLGEDAVVDDRWLRAAATFFAVAVLVHNSDHLRRGGDSVSADVFWIGTLAIVLEVGVVALVFMRHPSAPLAASVVGFSLAVGYLFVHFTPERGWLSDSFPSGDAAAISWFAGGLETVSAVLLGAAGAVVLHQRGGLASAASGGEHEVDRLSLATTLRHPVVLVMLLGNVVILIGSLLTL
jgi:hypothetical protein